jgi:GMP synthase-like glutamine amidotransferase
MRAHYLQHVAFEGLGSIEDWLLSHQYQISVTRLYESAEFPQVKDVDLLIIMGGPMSVNDEKELPWLIAEKQFVKAVIDAGKPVLGICLGAQMIADVMGSNIFPNSQKEIGWFPITARSTDPTHFQFPPSVTVFHWHGETFDLPRQATLLASSQACTNQAFQVGHNVIGLQFHLETTLDSLKEISINCANEIVEGEFVQSVDKMLQEGKHHFEKINQLMNEVLIFITKI